MSASPLPKQRQQVLADNLAGTVHPDTLAAFEDAIRVFQSGANLSRAQFSALNKLFEELGKHGKAGVSDLPSVAVPVNLHIPLPFDPGGNLHALSPVYADVSGRLYRYDHTAKELVTLTP